MNNKATHTHNAYIVDYIRSEDAHPPFKDVVLQKRSANQPINFYSSVRVRVKKTLFILE